MSGGNASRSAATASARRRLVPLAAILAAGLLLRVALIVLFRNKPEYDVRVFISWAHLLMQYGTHGLYAHVDTIYHNTVNYPPGYQLILAAVTQVYRGLCPAPRESDVLLGMLLKAPAVGADLVLCVLAYSIVRRWYGPRAGLGAAALAAFSPAMWPVSALWGQVDSICAMFTVVALASSFSRRYTLSWLALAFAVLIKPFPVVVAPLLLVAHVRDERQRWRLLVGPAAALVAAYAASLPFAPTAAPLGVLRWLVGNYASGQSQTSVTSLNAYNLWTLLGTPASDSLRAYGLTLQVWGWVAFAVLLGATLTLYVRRSRACAPRAAQERVTTRAWFLVLAAVFCLLTRMHERYILYALALLPIVWFCGKVERAAAVTWLTTFVTCVILAFHVYGPGIMREIPAVPYGLAALNLVVLATLAASFLGVRRPRVPVAVELRSAFRPIRASSSVGQSPTDS